VEKEGQCGGPIELARTVEDKISSTYYVIWRIKSQRKENASYVSDKYYSSDGAELVSGGVKKEVHVLLEFMR